MTHQMDLETTYKTGFEVWHCPTCGRRFLLSWQPYQRIMLDPGDEQVSHFGSKGGLQMSPPSISEAEPGFPGDLRDALNDVLQDIDFDDWPSV